MLVLKGLKCFRRGASRKRNLMEIIYFLTIIKVLSGIELVVKLEQCVRYKIIIIIIIFLRYKIT